MKKQNNKNFLIKTSEYIRRKSIFLIRLIGYFAFTVIPIMIVGIAIISYNEPRFIEIITVYLVILISAVSVLFLPVIAYHLVKMIQMRRSASLVTLLVGRIISIDTWRRNKDCSAEVILGGRKEIIAFTVYNNYDDYDMVESTKEVTIAFNEKTKHCIFIGLENIINEIEQNKI